MPRSRPWRCGHLGRHFAFDARRKERPGPLAKPQQRCEQARARNDGLQPETEEAFGRSASDFSLDDAAPDVDQSPILDPGWTGRFACTAGEAAIEMELRAL